MRPDCFIMTFYEFTFRQDLMHIFHSTSNWEKNFPRISTQKVYKYKINRDRNKYETLSESQHALNNAMN